MNQSHEQSIRKKGNARSDLNSIQEVSHQKQLRNLNSSKRPVPRNEKPLLGGLKPRQPNFESMKTMGTSNLISNSNGQEATTVQNSDYKKLNRVQTIQEEVRNDMD